MRNAARIDNIILLLLLLLLLLLFISFMQDIYNCIIETNHASRVYRFAGKILGACNVISHAECFVHNISTSRSLCSVHNMAVCCSSLISPLPSLLLRYCLSDFEMLPVTPIIIGIAFVFKFHVRCFSNVRYFYFLEFSRLIF